MPLESQRDPDFDARSATWLAPSAAHDRAVRRRSISVVPAAFAVAVAV